jgi:hypothetical protein
MSLGCLTDDKDGWSANVTYICKLDVLYHLRQSLNTYYRLQICTLNQTRSLHILEASTFVVSFLYSYFSFLFAASLHNFVGAPSHVRITIRTCDEALFLTQTHPLLSSLQLSPPIQLSFQLSRFPTCCGIILIHKQCKTRRIYFYLTGSKPST